MKGTASLGRLMARIRSSFGKKKLPPGEANVQRFENVPVPKTPRQKYNRRSPRGPGQQRREKFGNGLTRHLGGARKGWIA